MGKVGFVSDPFVLHLFGADLRRHRRRGTGRLQAQNIRLCGGVSGSADEAAAAFAAGNLVYQDAANCDHHAHGAGGCGDHAEGCGHHHA